jgi:hypothetical protein
MAVESSGFCRTRSARVVCCGLLLGLGGAGCGSPGAGGGVQPGGSGGNGAGAPSGGSGGVPAGAGGASIVDALPEVAGSGGAAPPEGDAASVDKDAPVDGPRSGCPADAIICEDFESYADGAKEFGSSWRAYAYGGGTVAVDSTKPHSGTRALHLTAPTGSRKYADIIRDTPDGTQLLPLKHYGRLMVWISAVPDGAHWNINQAAGLVAGSTTNVAKYSEGGMYGKLLPNYTLRTRVTGTADTFRGGGPEVGDTNNPATLDCSTPAKTQTVAARQWVCWEWMFDGTNRELALWLNGVRQTDVDVMGMGARCQTPNHPWDGPQMFTRVILGWEQYTTPASNVNQEVWLDDVAMGPNRIGCP